MTDWIPGLFRRKQNVNFINSTQKDQINKLVMIAALEKDIHPNDFQTISQKLHFVRYEVKPNVGQQIINYKMEMPMTTKEKFSLIFIIVHSLMDDSGNKMDDMLNKIAQSLRLRNEKPHELVAFIKGNIQNGLSLEASYLRLGYLINLPKNRY